MDLALKDALTNDYWTDYVRYLYEKYMLEGETVSIYFEDNSNYYTDVDLGYMRFGILAVDDYIDLDFEIISDFTASDIDIFLYDRSYQDYLGLATLQPSWISLEILGDFQETWSSNINTFIHEFMHALGIGEPGFDQRWDQDDTAMSYNQGDGIDWRIFPTTADFAALSSLWGYEDDVQPSPSRYQGLEVLGDSTQNDFLTGSSSGDFLMGFGGDDVINGGDGDDDLFGGYGSDTFIGSQGYDRVFDFTLGVDQIEGFTSSGFYQSSQHGVLIQQENSQMLLVGIDFNDFNATADYSFV